MHSPARCAVIRRRGVRAPRACTAVLGALTLSAASCIRRFLRLEPGRPHSSSTSARTSSRHRRPAAPILLGASGLLLPLLLLLLPPPLLLSLESAHEPPAENKVPLMSVPVPTLARVLARIMMCSRSSRLMPRFSLRPSLFRTGHSSECRAAVRCLHAAEHQCAVSHSAHRNGIVGVGSPTKRPRQQWQVTSEKRSDTHSAVGHVESTTSPRRTLRLGARKSPRPADGVSCSVKCAGRRSHIRHSKEHLIRGAYLRFFFSPKPKLYHNPRSAMGALTSTIRNGGMWLEQDQHATASAVFEMRYHAHDDVLAAEQGCTAICHHTRSIDICPSLCSDIVEVLLSTMRAYPHNNIVQAEGCGVLQNLSTIDNRVRVATHETIDALLQSMRLHPDNTVVQARACGAFRNLAVQPGISAIIGSLGGVFAVLKVQRSRTAASRDNQTNGGNQTAGHGASSLEPANS